MSGLLKSHASLLNIVVANRERLCSKDAAHINAIIEDAKRCQEATEQVPREASPLMTLYSTMHPNKNVMQIARQNIALIDAVFGLGDF